MKTRIFAILFMLCFIVGLGAHAQDTIFFKDGDVVKGWVTEKSDSEIKYRIYNTADSPIIVTNAKNVDKLAFRDGQVMKIYPYENHPIGKLGFSGGLMLSLSMDIGVYKLESDYFINPQTDIVLQSIIDGNQGMGINLGAKYYLYPYDEKKLKPFVGLTLGTIHQDFALQVPIGLHYTNKRGFDLKLGITELYIPGYNEFIPLAEILCGWRFLKQTDN